MATLMMVAAPALVSLASEHRADAPGFERQFHAGREHYGKTCVVCHQADGRGIRGGVPPLAQSDFLMADKARAIDVVLHGLSGPVVVNGQVFNGDMPSWARTFSDEEIASILTFVRNSWGNQGEPVRPEEVARARAPAAP